jgi:predicted AlkP superfamily phosphohydrolase/phosphomutase
MEDDPDRASEEMLELIKSRYRAAEHLLKSHDIEFLQVTTFYINSLHHFLWDDEYTLRAWKIVDEFLGRYLERDCNVVMMSDHGSNEIQTVFNVNTWLEKEGYLVLDSSVSDTLHSIGINKDRLFRLTQEIGIESLAKRLTPAWLRNLVPDERGELQRDAKTDVINWDRTEAVASGQGPIYLTVNPSENRYRELRDELVAKLKSLTDLDGNSVADDVVYKDEVYSGPFVEEGPDIVVDQAKGVHIPGNVGGDKTFQSPADRGWRAENKRAGLFAAAGPDFRTGSVEDLSILDLAPTLLHLHSLAVPEDMDGEVRTDLFAPESEPARTEPTEMQVSQAMSDDDGSFDEKTVDHLRDLGYID